ncbi:MAG: lipid II flippase MurJ, partial [Myxococcota bacterium]
MLAALTLVSRVAGLARDVVVGAVFGASTAADAFFVAFRIPNLFRRIVAEGAASSAFVPVFTSELARGGPAAAAESARVVGWAATVWLSLLVLVGMYFSD